MKKRNQLKRFLAMMLACTMVFQQAGISTLAEETMTEAAQTQELSAEQSEAESKAAAEAQAAAESEAKAKAEAQAKAEAEAKAKAEAEAKAQSEAESKAAAEAEAAKAQSEAESKAAAEAEAAKAQSEAESKAAEEAEAAKAQSEAESKAAAEAEAAKAQSEAESKAAAEASQTEAQPTEAQTQATEAPSETATEKTTEASTEAATEAQTQATEVPGETTTEQTTETSAETTAEETTEAATEETTEKATEPETESETETEASYKNEFTYSTTDMNANVVLSGEKAMTDKASFVVEKKDKLIDVEYYTGAYNAVKQLVAAGGLEIADAAVFDVAFLVDGAETEPAGGTATVTMTFPAGLDVCAGQTAQVRAYHIANGIAQDVTQSVTMTEDGKVGSVTILLNSFSPVVIAGLVQPVIEEAVEETAAEAEELAEGEVETSDDLTKYFTDLKITVNGQEPDPTKPAAPTSSFHFSIQFSEKKDLPRLARTVYFDLPKDSLINWPESGELLDKQTNQKAADYTIDANGHVAVTFTDAFMATAEDGYAAGDFYFDAGIKCNNETGEITIQVPGTELKKTVYIDTNAGLKADKQASYDQATGEITYTVEVSAYTGKVTDVVIADTLGANLEIVKTSNQKDYILTKADGTSVEGNFDADGKAMIGELDADQKVTLVYKAKFKDGVFNKDSLTITDSSATGNSVKAEGKNNGKDVVSNEPSVNVGDWFKNYDWINKSIEKTEDKDGKTYCKWKATYNNSKLVSVHGKTITDTLQDDYENFKAGDVIKVTRSDNVTFDIIVPADGKTWSYTIGENGKDVYTSGKEAYSYTFEYAALVDSDKVSGILGNVGAKNNISDGSHDKTADGSIPGGLALPGKKATGITAEKASWQVTVHVPKDGMDFYFEDSATSSNDWQKSSTIDADSIRITTSPEGISVPYVYQPYVDSHNIRSRKGYFFFGDKVSSTADIEANKSVSKLPEASSAYDVIITYDTFNKYLDENGQEVAIPKGETITNVIEVNNIKIPATNNVPGDLEVKKNQESNYTNVDGKYYSTGDNKICYSIQIDTGRYGLGDGNVEVIDTPSKNLSYVEGSAGLLLSESIYGGSDKVGGTEFYTKWVKKVDPEIQADGSLKFSLTGLTEKDDEGKPYIYRLYYQMEVDSSVFTSPEGTKLSNKASVSANGDAAVDTNEIEYIYKKPVLTKTETQPPSYANGYTAKYEIAIPFSKQFVQDRIFTIRDDFSESLSVNFDSIQIQRNYYQMLGADEYKVDVDDKGMSIQILNPPEDTTYYKVWYSAQIKGALGTEISYKNIAYVPGHEDKKSVVDEKVTKTQNSGGSIGREVYSFYIFKNDKNSVVTGLKSAAFKLLDDEGNVLLEDITTGDNGKSVEIKSSMLNNNHMFEPYKKYTLIETKAPEGYILDPTPIEFYFTNDTLDDTGIAAAGLSKALAIYKQGTITLPNEKSGLAIKKVDDTTDDVLSGAQFALYMDEECKDENKVAVSVESGNGIYAFPELVDGTYYLKETVAPSEYKLSQTVYTVIIKDGVYSVDGHSLESGTVANLLKVPNSRIKKGSLAVTKSVSGNTAPADTTEYTVIVTPADTTADLSTVTATSSIADKEVDLTATQSAVTFTFVKDETVTLNGLPYGDYTVTETVADDAVFTATYTVENNNPTATVVTAESNAPVDGGDTTDDGDGAGDENVPANSASVTIGENVPTVTVMNTYPNEGSLTVHKVKVGGNAADKFTFKVTLTTEKDGAEEAYSGTYRLGESTDKLTYDANAGITFELGADEERTVSGLPIGTKFTVAETSYEGYKPSWTNNTNSGTITDDTLDLELTCTNTAVGELTIVKQDEHGVKITSSAATFRLYKREAGSSTKLYLKDSEDESKLEWTPYAHEARTLTTSVTGSDGNTVVVGTVTVSGLEYGTYYVEEVTAPTGYDKETDPVSVTIDNSTVNAEVTNTAKKGSVQFTKVDGSTPAVPLSGAKFVILQEVNGTPAVYIPEFTVTIPEAGADDQTPDSIETPLGSDVKMIVDANGLVTISGLEWGNYTLRETKAPDGYALPANPDHEFTIDETLFAADKDPFGTVVIGDDGKPGQIVNNEDNGSLKIVKAVTGLYNSTEAYTDTFYFTVTSTDGTGTTYYDKDGNPSADVQVLTMNYNSAQAESKVLPVTGLKKKDANGDYVTYKVTEVADTQGTALTDTHKFTVTYAVNGQAGRETSFELHNAPEVDVTNTLNRGSAVFTKKDAVSDAVLSGAKFELYRANSDGEKIADAKILSFTAAKNTSVTYENGFTVGDASVDYDNNGQATISNLRYGTYVLVETEAPAGYDTPTGTNAEYTFEVNGDSVEIVTGGVITNGKSKGSILVTKKVIGTNDTTILNGKEFDFTFTFSDPDFDKTGKDYKVVKKDLDDGTEDASANIVWEFDATKKEVTGTIKLKHNESVQVSDIPVGVVYVVAETADEDYITQYSINSAAAVTGTSATGKIEGTGDDEEKVDFTNTKKAVLNITKNQVGGETDTFTVVLQKENAVGSYEAWADQAYDVINADGTVESGKATNANGELTITGGQTIRIQVTDDVKYKLKETHDSISPYPYEEPAYQVTTGTTTGDMTADKDGFVSGEISSATEGSDAQTVSWTITNTYKSGSISFTKVDGKDTDKLVEACFTLYKVENNVDISYLTFETGTDSAGKPSVKKGPNFPKNVTLTIDENGLVTIGNLLWGTYKFTETSAKTAGYTGNYEYEGIVIDSTIQEYTLSSSDSDALSGMITNTKQTKDVSFKKIVNGTQGDKSKKYKFEIFIDDKYPNRDLSATGENKNYQYECEITSKSTAEDGTETTNTRTEKVYANTSGQTIQLSDGETAVIKGLPYGAEFRVEEINILTDMSASVEPGDQTAKLQNGVGVKGTISATDPGVTEFTNTKLMEITLTKEQVKGDPSDQFTFNFALSDAPAGGKYSVEYKKQDTPVAALSGSADMVTNGDNVIKLQGGMTATIKGVPSGAKYTITEDADSNYTTTNTKVVPADGQQQDANAGLTTGEQTVDGTNEATTFTNTHKTGSLKLSKTVSEGDEDKWFTFTVNLVRQNSTSKYPVEYYLVGESGVAEKVTADAMKQMLAGKTNPDEIAATQNSATIYLKHNMYAVIKDIETNTRWTVTETSDTDYTTTVNVNGAAAKQPATGVIAEDTQANTPANSAAFTNTIKKGSLSFEKKNYDGTETDEFVFQVKIGTDAEHLVPYVGEYTLTDRKGSAKVTLAEDAKGKITITDGQTVKIENLPYGTKYEVKELLNEAPDTNEDKYYSNSGDMSGEISASDKNPQKKFYNYIQQDLIVIKSASGGDKNAKFKFIISIPEPKPLSLDSEESEPGPGPCAKMPYILIDGEKETSEQTDEEGAFFLKSGQVARFEGLEQGDHFVIEEQNEKGYKIWNTTVRVDAGDVLPYADADVTIDMQPVVVRFTNTGIKANATFQKIDSETKTAISGAKFELYKVEEDKKEYQLGNEFTVDIPKDKATDIKLTSDVTVTIDTDGLVTIIGLDWGKYILRETAAPEGYALPVKTDTEFVIDKETFKVETANPDNGQDGGASNTTEGGSAPAQPTVPVKSIGSIENAKTRVLIDKVDADKNETSLKNAHLQILDTSKDEADPKRVVETWISDGKPHEVKGLTTGVTYVLHETVAPAGYELTKDTIFTLSANGTLNMDSTKTTVKVTGKTVNGEKSEVMLVEDKAIEIGFNKKDDKDAYLANAKLQIVVKDTKGDVVDSWISDGKSHDITGKLVGGESYILEELEAPTGYAVAEPIEFKVETDGTIIMGDQRLTSIDMVDAKLHFHVNKTVLGGEEEVAGAELTVIDKETGKVIDKWVSEVGKTYDFGEKLTAGKEYILRETVAPQGYAYTTDIDFKINLDGTVETNAKTTVDENNNTVYLVEDAKLSLNVNKTQLGNKDVEVEGARLELFDEEGNLVDFWISKKNETHDFGHKVQAGKKYTLKETVAPDGYGYATDIVFEITKDGKVVTDAPFTTDEKGNKTFLVEDAKVKFNVNKVDLGNGDELEGAELVVIDKETGTVIDTWKSEIGKTHDFGDKLTAGKEYILRETVAPNGYEVTTDIEFRVENDGSITTTAKTTVDKDGNVTYLVQDQITTVKVNKIDAVDGRTLTGAHLQLLDETGKVVEEWDSAAQARELKGLVAGKTYTLHETIAPAGYVVNTVDVTLTLDAKGEIDKTKTTAKISEDGTVLVENNMVKSETASISVTKQLTYNGAPITAIDQTFYVALYVDAACTNRVSDIKPVVFKEASSSTVEFKGLDLGRMYYIGECDANGTSLVTGALADGTIYAANFAAGNQATVTDANGVTRITFENEFHELPAGFYKEGELTITKKLIGGDGEAVDSDEVFYAGIFADKNYKKLSDQVSQNIVELALNGGSEVSEKVMVAVTSGQATKLYVTEVDADGNPVAGSAGFEYEVTVSKTSVSLDEEHTKASVTITNKIVEEETETEAEKKKETPKTGDETPIMPYLGLLLAAGFVLILGAYRRRRNAK